MTVNGKSKKITVINIGRGYVISLILAVVGLVWIASGVKSYILIQQSLPLGELTLQQCREGQYVEGEITQYAVGNGQVSGESVRILSGFKEYGIYTVKIAGDEYISVVIADRELLKELETYESGCGNGVYIEGKIVKSSMELNYQWLKKAFGIEDEAQINQIVSPTYEIRAISFKQEKMMIVYGGMACIFALLIFVASGGVKNFISHEDVKNPLPVAQEVKYNLENEIEISKRHLEKMLEKQALIQKRFFYRIPLLLLGIVIIVKNYLFEIKLVGIVCVIIFVRAAWQLFINSDLLPARYICGIFGLDSLHKQIGECRKKIAQYAVNKFEQ